MFLLVVITRAAIGAACFEVWWRFNNHQEVQYPEEGSEKKVETSENVWGYVAVEGESESSGQEPPGPQKESRNFWNFF